MISTIMAIANLAVVILVMQRYTIPAGGVFLAIAAAVAAGAIVQRAQFGRRTDSKARFDPIVTAASIAAFNAALVIVLMIRS